jgi:hypothetical protein
MTTHRKQIPLHFLDRLFIAFNPAFGAEGVYVLAEYALVAVNGPGVDPDDRVLGEMDAVERDAAGGRASLEDESGCGMNSHGFIDDSRAVCVEGALACSNNTTSGIQKSCI